MLSGVFCTDDLRLERSSESSPIAVLAESLGTTAISRVVELQQAREVLLKSLR